MIIRHTTQQDLNEVMAIYQEAISFMRETGNIHQWINGYPQPEIILEDIRLKRSYVVLDDCQKIIGVMMYQQGIDPTYLYIEGQWLNDEPYGVIHRIASLKAVKGVGAFCFDWALKQCPNLRIDTHQDNLPMKRLLFKQNFKECGIIYLSNGEPRLAYHKVKKD